MTPPTTFGHLIGRYGVPILPIQTRKAGGTVENRPLQGNAMIAAPTVGAVLRAALMYVIENLHQGGPLTPPLQWERRDHTPSQKSSINTPETFSISMISRRLWGLHTMKQP